MGIKKFYTSTATVQRESFVPGSTVKKEFVNHIVGVKCNFQAQSSEAVQQLTGAFGKTFNMFCDVLDIDEGDRVIIDGITYGVQGVETFRMGQNPHLRIALSVFRS